MTPIRPIFSPWTPIWALFIFFWFCVRPDICCFSLFSSLAFRTGHLIQLYTSTQNYMHAYRKKINLCQNPGILYMPMYKLSTSDVNQYNLIPFNLTWYKLIFWWAYWSSVATSLAMASCQWMVSCIGSTSWIVFFFGFQAW